MPSRHPIINPVLALIIALIAAATPTAAQPSPLQHAFASANPLPGATVAHSAAVLNDGNILVTGGYGQLFGLPLAVNFARLYDTATNQWQGLRDHLVVGRLLHSSITLPDGRVLIVGGIGQTGRNLRSVECFDPDTRRFSLVGELQAAHQQPGLNLLPDNAVLVTGQNRTAEIIQPLGSDFTFRPVPHRNHASRLGHVALTLADHRVLLLGGSTRLIEIFDPATESFSTLQTSLPAPYNDIAAARLHDHTVLLAGGQHFFTSVSVPHTFILDPYHDRLTSGPSLTPTARGRACPGASDLAALDLYADDPCRAGRYIFLCGGEYDPGKKQTDVILDSAWVYRADQNDLINVGPMPHEHDDFALVPLPPRQNCRRALIIAGHGKNDSFQAHCDMFQWCSAP